MGDKACRWPRKNFYVEVVEAETEAVTRVVVCRSGDEAERVESGLDINLNHRLFYTRIIAPPQKGL